MAVEALTIVNGPMAGLGESGPVDKITGWMHQNGVNPTYLGVGALVGAFMSRRGFVAGAVVGAAIVFTSQALWNQIR